MGNDESRYGRGVVIQTLPTLAHRQAQTGTIPGCAAHWGAAAIQTESGVKYHPNVTANGHTERCNPTAALSTGEQATSRTPSPGRIAQEANASQKREDTLTWARHVGR
jgi:hypothetical protein